MKLKKQNARMLYSKKQNVPNFNILRPSSKHRITFLKVVRYFE